MKHCINDILFPADLPEYLDGVTLDKLDVLLQKLGKTFDSIPDDQGSSLQPWLNVYSELLCSEDIEVGPPNYTAVEFKMAFWELSERLDDTSFSDISDEFIRKALSTTQEILGLLTYSCDNETFDNPTACNGGEDEQSNDPTNEDGSV